MPSISRYYSSTAAKTTLASAIDSSSASLELAAASGLPSQYPFTLILEKDTANEEIVEVTALVGSAYSITRAVDGSSAKSHSIGAVVEHGVSARDFSESRSHEAATSAHGVTGDVVGTGGAQAITGQKTLTSPILTGTPVITGLSSAGMIASSATPKNYVDSILGSATAASTSAASAATSASSAATSASSAAASASAAATSASSALTSQTAAATSATSAAASASAASTSAASALASQTAAATSATSAAASATAAATSATSAAASATTAAASVATIAGYATTASNSAAAATTSAASAATSASSAATSATSAANSATAAASSATTASNSAATATTSAASAITSAASAATSESNAATSASSAATSASSAATSYDDFDDRYLGDKVADPSLDNDGNALLTGALYFNTGIPAMKVYTGSAWQIIAPNTTNFIDKAVFTAQGDVIVATGSGTYTTLSAASTSGYILSVNSATATGLEWVAPNPGDITGVTAGTGLSGGGTSGDVTINIADSYTDEIKINAIMGVL